MTICLSPRFFFAVPMCLLIAFSLLAEDTFFISRPVSRLDSPTICKRPVSSSGTETSSSTNTVRNPCTRKRLATLTSAGWSLSLSFLAWVTSSSYPTSETFPIRSQSRSWRASCRRTTTRRRSSRCSGTTTRTAGLREAQVGQRVLTRAPVWPTHITNGFFSWRFAMSANGSAARRGKLTAGAIASRVALYDSGGTMEMNSAQNTKRTHRSPMPSTSSNN